MTNNDELALKLKAAAEKATSGNWYVDNDFDVCSENYGFVGELHGDNLVMNADFISTASPANILSLLAERDADKKRIAELERYAEVEASGADKVAKDAVYWMKRCRILEARTVSVKLPPVAFFDFRAGSGLSDGAHVNLAAMNKVLAAAGIKLEVGE